MVSRDGEAGDQVLDEEAAASLRSKEENNPLEDTSNNRNHPQVA